MAHNRVFDKVNFIETVDKCLRYKTLNKPINLKPILKANAFDFANYLYTNIFFTTLGNTLKKLYASVNTCSLYIRRNWKKISLTKEFFDFFFISLKFAELC